MSQTLLIALAISIPLAGLAWLAALGIEASGAGLALRLRAWRAAFLLPLAVVPAMLIIHLAGVQSPLAWSHDTVPAVPQPSTSVIAETQMTTLLPQAGSEVPSLSVHVSPTPILLTLLTVGAALRIFGLMLSLRRVAKLAAGSRPLDPALGERLGRRVRQADTDTPVLAGLVKPVIFLPRALLDHMSIDQAALVCAHERAHLAAGDHVSHVLEEVIVRLFWFNHLLAAVRERLAAVREEACDARALTACDAAGRRVYAQTLITALKLAGEGQPVAAFTGFRRKGARRRLRAVLKPAGKGSPAAWIAAAAAGLGLTGVLGGLSLALAAEPVAAQRNPAPASPAAPTAPATPTDTTPPAPATPVRARHHTVVTVQESGDPDAKDAAGISAGSKTRSWVFDDGAFAGFADLDPSHMTTLTPEERERIAKAVEAAKAAAAQAREAGRLAAEEGRKRAEEGRKIAEEARAKTREQTERLRAEAEANLRAWRGSRAPDPNGKVLMRCSVKPDGSPSDCEKVTNPVMVLPNSAEAAETAAASGAPLTPSAAALHFVGAGAQGASCGRAVAQRQIPPALP